MQDILRPQHNKSIQGNACSQGNVCTKDNVHTQDTTCTLDNVHTGQCMHKGHYKPTGQHRHAGKCTRTGQCMHKGQCIDTGHYVRARRTNLAFQLGMCLTQPSRHYCSSLWCSAVWLRLPTTTSDLYVQVLDPSEHRNTDYLPHFSSSQFLSARPSAHATSGTSQRISVQFGSGVTGKLPCNAKSCT